MIKNNFLPAIERKSKVLTQRQIEIVQLLANGLQPKQIARHLRLEYSTVKNQIFRAKNRLAIPWKLRSETALVAVAFHWGLII